MNMRAGYATVYPGPPTWEPVETLRACSFKMPRRFLVGRSLPGEVYVAVAWLQLDGQWSYDENGQQALAWNPLYMSTAPSDPPWPPPDHPDMIKP